MESQPVFDKPGALARVDNDLELYFELVDMLFADYQRNIDTIRTAVSSADARGVEESAHSLKSALGNLGAMRAFEVAHTLEKVGREGDLGDASNQVELLVSEVDAYRVAVAAFRAS